MIATISNQTPCTVSLPVSQAPDQTLPDHLSWSQVNLMRMCPKKYFFQYLAKEKPDFVPSSLKFGSAIHATLEAHFIAYMQGIGTGSDALLAAYREAWEQCDDPSIPIRYNKDEDSEKLEALAARMVDTFLRSPMAEPIGHIIAVEESIRANIASDLPPVVARVDLIWQDGAGTTHLLDFKTSRSRWNAEQVARNADQLRLYHALAGRLADGRPIALHFGVLTKAKKTPVVEVFDVPATAAEDSATTIADKIRPVWEAIMAHNFYPVPSPQNCTTCPFKSRCPAYADQA